MSTNKTPNYNLHSWLPADEFHVSEVNENFAALDRELALETEALQDAFADEVGELKTALTGKADKTALAAVQSALAAKAEVVTGSFVGSGGTKSVQLGFKPRLVILAAIPGYLTDVVHYGLAYPDGSFGGYLTVTDSGFTVKSDNGVNLNHANWTYLYAVFR